MTDPAFTAFLTRRKQQAQEDIRIDWSSRRAEWLTELQILFEKIELLLQDYILSQDIILRYETIRLNEEKIGSYDCRRLILTIGLDEIEFLPIGTMIFGGRGRVDMIGPAGRIKLVLVDRNAARTEIKVTIVDDDRPAESEPAPIAWTWKIAGSPPSIAFTELTSESLTQAIMEVANA